MKKAVLSLFLVVILCFSSGCGAMVDLNTPKSADLSAQYDYYEKSVSEIRSGMKVTPEQADEIFLVLVECGLDGKITSVSESGKGDSLFYSTYGGGGGFKVYLIDGVVETVKSDKQGGKVVYPAQLDESTEPISGEAEPEAPATLETAIDSAIEAARAEKVDVKIMENFGTENPDDKNIEIFLIGKDNLSAKLIRNGILIQANDILKELQPREEIAQVCLFWNMPLVDSYGNTKDWNVVKILVSGETLGKINFEAFDWNSFSDIADDYYIHSSLTD